MTDMQIFQHDTFGNVRMLEEDGKILFCGADVATALGYSKPRNAIAMHCKGALKRGTLTSGGMQELSFLPESDVYRLIVHSKLPTAEKFEKWLFEDVLPTIRKHGAYMTDAKIEEALLSPETIINLATQIKEEREKRMALAQVAAPAIAYLDSMTETKGASLIRDFAKELQQCGYETGGLRFFQYLRDNGYLVKRGLDKNAPTQKSVELGLFRVVQNKHKDSNGETIITNTTRITGKGKAYFIKKLCGESGMRIAQELKVI